MPFFLELEQFSVITLHFSTSKKYFFKKRRMWFYLTTCSLSSLSCVWFFILNVVYSWYSNIDTWYWSKYIHTKASCHPIHTHLCNMFILNNCATFFLLVNDSWGIWKLKQWKRMETDTWRNISQSFYPHFKPILVI